MKMWIGLGILIFSSVGLAWNKKAVQDYSAAASYEELFCGGRASSESCRHYRKTLGAGISARPLSVSMEDASTLMVSSNTSTVRAKNAASSTVYEVNGKRIDLLAFSAQSEVREGVAAAIPKVAATSTLPDASQTPEVGEVDLRVVASLDFLIVHSQEMNSCEGLFKFVTQCIDQGYELDAAIIQSKSAWDGAKIAAKVKQIEAAKEYTQRLDKLAAVIQKAKVSWAPAELQKCAARFDPTLPSNFQICRQTIQDYSQALKVMNQKMQLQRAQQVIDEQTVPALATPTQKTKAGNRSGTR